MPGITKKVVVAPESVDDIVELSPMRRKTVAWVPLIVVVATPETTHVVVVQTGTPACVIVPEAFRFWAIVILPLVLISSCGVFVIPSWLTPAEKNIGWTVWKYAFVPSSPKNHLLVEAPNR